jgi:uncharacterized protein
MPLGKPAGVRCIQLDELERCKLFGKPQRPLVCKTLTPTFEMCGESRVQAMLFLSKLESATQPAATTLATTGPN